MEGRQLIQLIKERRSVRAFASTPVSDEDLQSIIECAHSAPSGFNLQPWHFVLVRDPKLRALMRPIAMNQRQVEEAPVVLVFLANLEAWRTEYEQVLAEGIKSGLLDRPRVERYRRLVRLHFRTGPLGLMGFLKRLALPLLRIKQPFPASLGSGEDVRAYVNSQTFLAAQNAMIAAKALGLDTCPMEGFDESRLKRLLGIPSRFSVPLIMPLGYKLPGSPLEQTYRVPVKSRVHLDHF